MTKTTKAKFYYSKKKESVNLWGSKIKKPLNELAQSYTNSFSFDYRLFDVDIKQSLAHVQMLEKGGLITTLDKKQLTTALNKLRKQINKEIKEGKFDLNAPYEDIHTYIESNVTRLTGRNVGEKLHTARSRNDQVSADTRLFIRENGFKICELLAEMMLDINALARKYKYHIMPAYTHMQLAKPIYFRDYIRAFYEMFQRDLERLNDCINRLNYSPLGSGAVGGTHYKKINRFFIAKKLDFAHYIKNTVDSVSDRDYIVEYLFVLSMIMMHFSRLSEDFVTWSSPQYNFITIDKSFMTGSSILPQKKNPDVCEIARGKTGRVYGNLVAMLTVMKGMPLTYNRDMQEDKEALFDSHDTVSSTLKTYIKLIRTLRINKKNRTNMLIAIKQEEGFSNASRYVDYLVDKKEYSLRTAYEFVSRLVHYCDSKNSTLENIKDSDLDNFIKREIKIDKKSIELLKKYVNS